MVEGAGLRSGGIPRRMTADISTDHLTRSNRARRIYCAVQ